MSLALGFLRPPPPSRPNACGLVAGDRPAAHRAAAAAFRPRTDQPEDGPACRASTPGRVSLRRLAAETPASKRPARRQAGSPQSGEKLGPREALVVLGRLPWPCSPGPAPRSRRFRMCPGYWSGVCPKHLRSDGLLLGYSTLLSTKNEQHRFKRERRAALEAHAAPGPRGRCRRPSLRAPCVSPPSPPSPCGHLQCWPQSGSGRAPAAGSCRSPRVSRPLSRGEAAILTVGPSRAEPGPPGEGQAGPWPRPTGRPPPPALSSPGPSPSSFSARPRPRDA